MKNIRVVDEGIKNVTEMFTAYFGDDQRTTFIVTSDHGMTSWGAHGTGLPSETETPFIAWGAGIKKPVFTTNVNHDPQTRKWDLDSYLRTDIKQVDIATLVPFLLGKSRTKIYDGGDLITYENLVTFYRVIFSSLSLFSDD